MLGWYVHGCSLPFLSRFSSSCCLNISRSSCGVAHVHVGRTNMWSFWYACAYSCDELYFLPRLYSIARFIPCSDEYGIIMPPPELWNSGAVRCACRRTLPYVQFDATFNNWLCFAARCGVIILMSEFHQHFHPVQLICHTSYLAYAGIINEVISSHHFASSSGVMHGSLCLSRRSLLS